MAAGVAYRHITAFHRSPNGRHQLGDEWELVSNLLVPLANLAVPMIRGVPGVGLAPLPNCRVIWTRCNEIPLEGEHLILEVCHHHFTVALWEERLDLGPGRWGLDAHVHRRT